MTSYLTLSPGSEHILQDSYDAVRTAAIKGLNLSFPDIEFEVVPHPKLSVTGGSMLVESIHTNYRKIDNQIVDVKFHAQFGSGLYLPSELGIVVAHTGGHAYQGYNNARLLLHDGETSDDVKDKSILLTEGWATRVEEVLAGHMNIDLESLLKYLHLRHTGEYEEGRNIFQRIGEKGGWEAEVSAAIKCKDDDELLSGLQNI